MSIYNPPHPGEFIKVTYLDAFDISQNKIADKLDVARSTFSRLIRGDSRISPEMALRLSQVIGRSPESWLAMQDNYDLFQIKKQQKGIRKLKRFVFNSRACS